MVWCRRRAAAAARVATGWVLGLGVEPESEKKMNWGAESYKYHLMNAAAAACLFRLLSDSC